MARRMQATEADRVDGIVESTFVAADESATQRLGVIGYRFVESLAFRLPLLKFLVAKSINPRCSASRTVGCLDSRDRQGAKTTPISGARGRFAYLNEGDPRRGE